MKLIKILENEISKIKKLRFEYEEEYEFFENLSNEIAKNKDLSNINIEDVLTAIITINSEYEFNYIKDRIDFLPDALDEEIFGFLKVVLSLEELNMLEEILSKDEEVSSKKMHATTDSNSIKEKSHKFSLLIKYKKYGLEIFENYKKINAFTRLIKGISLKTLHTFVEFLNYRNNYIVIQSAKSREFKQICKMFDVSGTALNKYTELFDTPDLNEFLKDVSERNYMLTKLRKNFNSDNRKKILLYEKAIKLLEKISEDTLTEIPDEIMNKLDDDILIELIKVILNNNRNIYTNLQIENIKRNYYNEIETKFLQNNIDLNKLSLEEKDILINNIKVETLDKILVYLNNPEWKWLKNHPNFVQVLLNTNESIFASITYWLNNRIMSIETIQKNIGILLENNDIRVNKLDVTACFINVRNNIMILSKITELSNKTYKNGEILFMETSLLKQVIDLTKKYKLNFQCENSKSYSLDIITEFDKFDDLDSFIELGFKDYIINNVQLLNENSKEIIERLSIMVNTGLNPYSIEDRLSSSIITGKNFFVSNENLSEFNLVKAEEYIDNKNYEILRNEPRLVISKTTLELDIVRYFDGLYKLSELEYNFDNIIISRIKFLRNLECLIKNGIEINDETIISALTYNSNLDLEFIDFIKKSILELNGKQYKKESK